MAGRIESGPPSVPPQIDSADVGSTDAVETVKQAETSSPAELPADNAGTTALMDNPSGQLAELAFSGMALAAQFQGLIGENFSTLPTAEILVRNDNQHDPKPEILDLQKQINQWRAENGKPPIKEDGFFGEKTERALLEFQRATGLKPDCKAGIATQNRMLLENDPSFKKLDSGIKDQIRALMTGYGQDDAMIQNLRNFATAPGLSELSPAHQQQMLDIQKAYPDYSELASELTTLANDPTFRSLNDATKTDVLNQVSGYVGYSGKIDNLTKLVTSTGFEQLSPALQKQMLGALAASPDDAQLAEGLGKLAGNTAFRDSSDAIKGSLIDTLSKSPPLTNEKLNSTLGLIGSPQFRRLSDAEKALVAEGLKGAKANPAYADNVKSLLDDVKFQTLKPEERTAVLSQIKNYPDPRSVANIDRVLQKDWFASQDLGDKQRSLKTVAFLSQYDAGDRKVIENTLDKFLSPTSDFKLVWKDYTASPKEIYYGEGDEKIKTLYLNRGLLPADDKKINLNGQTRELVLATVPHEVNHILNKDKVADTFHYFEAEYRAWYTGFEAQYGRVPTNQEAMEQRISWQLNPDSFYGKHAADALKDPKEAQKFYDFLSQMSGQKVDASNWKTVIASDASKWPSASGAAPVPSGNIDNH